MHFCLICSHRVEGDEMDHRLIVHNGTTIREHRNGDQRRYSGWPPRGAEREASHHGYLAAIEALAQSKSIPRETTA